MASPVCISDAANCASNGRLEEMSKICDRLTEDAASPSLLLEVGALLLGFGYLSQAEKNFRRCLELEPKNSAAQINLASVAHASGRHAEVGRMYAKLALQYSDNLIVRRNLLTASEYSLLAEDDERLNAAKAWGSWAINRSGGLRCRPALKQLSGRPLRVGYVSADICQHTVGLLLKDVLKSHDAQRVTAFVYNAGRQRDWVTNDISLSCIVRDASALDDLQLVDLVIEDQIDVLVDLSGHTAGSRLAAFAYRPAPVMVSWLGYFATTGLPYFDGLLLDEWHVTAATQEQFVEPVIKLSGGRFCYKPVPWAPVEVALPACLRNGYVTFGCFNNTAKINESVIEVWAKILNALPESRLILKWRTFNDEAYSQKMWAAFRELGVTPDRIELRGPSFHKDLLLEYADIDIALDPFPFTGGLTTCETLWMGVPVVTMPLSRVVSRQSHAILNMIGLEDLSAESKEQYVSIALNLAKDHERLIALRSNLRKMLRESSLMDVTGFTQALEDCFFELYRRIERAESIMGKRLVLHVGPGHKNNGAKLPLNLQGQGWSEVRLDIDPNNEPDIVGSILDMKAVSDQSFDVVYSSHNIEHVYEYQVEQVLQEFWRVLKPGGYVLITCPDLQCIGQWLLDDRLTDNAYQSPAGGIRPLDMLYGHCASIASGNPYMAHKTGFTLTSLSAALKKVGFARTAGKRRPDSFDLWMLAAKGDISIDDLRKIAERLLP